MSPSPAKSPPPAHASVPKAQSRPRLSSSPLLATVNLSVPVFPPQSPDLCHTAISIFFRGPTSPVCSCVVHLSILLTGTLTQYYVPVQSPTSSSPVPRTSYHLIPLDLVLCPGLYLHFAFPLPASLGLSDGNVFIA